MNKNYQKPVRKCRIMCLETSELRATTKEAANIEGLIPFFVQMGNLQAQIWFVVMKKCNECFTWSEVHQKMHSMNISHETQDSTAAFCTSGDTGSG